MRSQGLLGRAEPDTAGHRDKVELHRMEGWYRALELAGKTRRQAIHALAVQWLNQVEMPAEGITILEHGQPVQAAALTLDEQGEVVVCLRDGTRRLLPPGTCARAR